MNLNVLGINFRTAPVEVRETASLRPDQIPATLLQIRERLPEAEALVVSTCNRTELYLAGVDAATHKQMLIEALLPEGTPVPLNGLLKHFYLKQGPEAAEHLLAVASSLDSMVVGETEILGQIKQAYSLASQSETLGASLHPLFHAAFRTAKRVFSETDICQGRVSVSSIAVEFTLKIFSDLTEKTVMIVGAGETAELALKSLVEKGVREVLVLNRSFEKGKALADKYGGTALPFEQLGAALPRADIVVSSTAAPQCVVVTTDVHEAVRARRGQPMLLIDIAVPRDIETGVGEVDNVYLYHIDDLQRLADANLARRKTAVEAAWDIVRAEAEDMVFSFGSRGFGNMMRQLDARAADVKAAALKRSLSKEKMAGLPEPVRREIDEMAQKIVMSMLAKPRAALKRAARDGRWDHYAQVTSDLFGLDKHKKE